MNIDSSTSTSTIPIHTAVPAQVAKVVVIVPTFNEAQNVRALVDRLEAALGTDGSHEVIFVDDSTDDTPQVINALQSQTRMPIRLLHRPPGQQPGGLSGAVAAGMRATSAPTVVVMDGDLQHPPEVLPDLLAALAGHDIAIASRYSEGGGATGLSNPLRRMVSTLSTLIARTLFPKRLRNCTDPMTGFFVLHRAALDLDRLEPTGFKILLEILARHTLRVAEVPFTFADRHAGESKADLRQGIAFLRQLLNLRVGRTMQFGLVGAIGVVVNLAAMTTLLTLGLNYLLASTVATELAIINNFYLLERCVFLDRTRSTASWRKRFSQFALFGNVENALRLPLLMLAVSGLGLNELLAQLLTLIVAFTARFLFTSRVLYPARTGRADNKDTQRRANTAVPTQRAGSPTH